MALSVCLLPDATAERTLRRLWQRLEDEGVPTLLSHTHGQHVPHLSFASLRSYDGPAVWSALERLPDAAATCVPFDGLGMFRRSRCWLLPAVSAGLVARQQAVAEAVQGTGADLHRHYLPGTWMPHLTVAPRVHLGELGTVARAVFEVLPMEVVFDTAALVDTGTGDVQPLAHLV